MQYFLAYTSYLAISVYISCFENEPADVHVRINTWIQLWVPEDVKGISLQIVCTTREYNCFVSYNFDTFDPI